jgi:hypothetical protein
MSKRLFSQLEEHVQQLRVKVKAAEACLNILATAPICTPGAGDFSVLPADVIRAIFGCLMYDMCETHIPMLRVRALARTCRSLYLESPLAMLTKIETDAPKRDVQRLVVFLWASSYFGPMYFLRRKWKPTDWFFDSLKGWSVQVIRIPCTNNVTHSSVTLATRPEVIVWGRGFIVRMESNECRSTCLPMRFFYPQRITDLLTRRLVASMPPVPPTSPTPPTPSASTVHTTAMTDMTTTTTATALPTAESSGSSEPLRPSEDVASHEPSVASL